MDARHTLVWLRSGAAWQALTPGAHPRLQAWFAAGHPAVVARREGGAAPGLLRLGVPLPPAEHKQRLALCAPAAAVARRAPPPALAEVIAHAPPARRSALRALAATASARATLPLPRVFGSYAWQALTNLGYVRDGSDLDLLWTVACRAQAEAIVAMLLDWEARHDLRADGELILPGGAAVAWREYASGAADLLAKAETGCRLLRRADLFAQRSAA